MYAACKNFVQLRSCPIQYAYDPVILAYKAGARPLQTKTPRRSMDWSVANTANMKTRQDSKPHPCPRPLDQTMELVANFTIDGGTVLDPFMGSGTTGVACQRLGRSFIGIEIDPAYHAIARRRDRAEQAKVAVCG